MAIENLGELPACQTPKDSFEELQKKASAYCGFDLSKPADLSALQVEYIRHDVNGREVLDDDNPFAIAGMPRKMSFTLTTRLRGWLQSETGEEDLIITIERKNVQQLPKLQPPL